MSQELLDEKNKVKGKRVSEALKEAKNKGEPVGRPRSVLYVDVRGLSMAGFTYRQIATQLGVSVSTIQRAINATMERRRKM